MRSFIIENRRWDPVTGTSSALLGVATGMFKGATDIVVKPVQTYHQRSKLKAAEAEDASSSRASSLRGHSPPPDSSRGLAPPQQSDELQRPVSAGRGSSNGAATAGAMFKASASGVGGFFKSYGKFYVDVPLAVTDGLRNAPKLYGEKVEERAPITDWKSGAIEGGKHFVTGLGGGFADLFVQPYKGGRDGGAAGAALGVGKGVLNMATKTASGEFYRYIHSSRKHLTNSLSQQRSESWRTPDRASTRASGQPLSPRRDTTLPPPGCAKASTSHATARSTFRLCCSSSTSCVRYKSRRKVASPLRMALEEASSTKRYPRDVCRMDGMNRLQDKASRPNTFEWFTCNEPTLSFLTDLLLKSPQQCSRVLSAGDLKPAWIMPRLPSNLASQDALE